MKRPDAGAHLSAKIGRRSAPAHPTRELQAGRTPGVLGVPHGARGRACTCGGRCPRCRHASRPGPERPVRRARRGPVPTSSAPIRDADDAHEREAERVAERVMRTPTLRRPGRVGGAGSPPSARSRSGDPLPARARTWFESRFGTDFSEVRVHTNLRAARAARALQASAFAVGPDIYFAPGRYDPEGSTGRRLLTHELTHVLQQRRPGARREVRRRVEAVPAPAGTDHIVALLQLLCPRVRIGRTGTTITADTSDASDQSCTCVTETIGDPGRTYTISVLPMTYRWSQETLHDGSTMLVPMPNLFPLAGPSGTDHPHIQMPGPGTTMEIGAFDPAGRPLVMPLWRILAHELCGHGRLRQGYAGTPGNRPGHDITIALENRIAAEQGSPPRGKFPDRRQGESFLRVPGDARVVFRLSDGLHYELP